jgi:hypothetical protein
MPYPQIIIILVLGISLIHPINNGFAEELVSMYGEPAAPFFYESEIRKGAL